MPAKIERYEVLNALGAGGMGEVFLAYDPKLKRRIALKRIRPERGGQQEPRDRFTIEARVTAMLQHPSIIPVYRFSSEGDDLFYTMRPVEGLTLADIIQRLRENVPGARDEWTVARLIRLFLQATGAIAFAHSKNVVHRDLKPSNIMIGPFEEVLVLDWGLAKVLGENDDGPAPEVEADAFASMALQTASQIIIGTPGYIAPDNLLEGQPASPEGDVYALGVILYELLALQWPWAGSDMSSLITSMRSEPPHPTRLQPGREIPAQLAEVALRAIHPDRGRRYTSVTRFAHDVADALEGRASWQPIEERRTSYAWRLNEGRIHDEDGELTFQSSGRKQEFAYVYTRPFFVSDVRVEFEFSLRKGRHSLGVTMNCADLRERESPTGYTLGIVEPKRRTLSLLRNGRDVAGSKSPQYEPKTWYKVVVERRGDHIRLSIDNEFIYGYSDPIPLRGGYVALVGASTGTTVRNLRMWSRGASSMVSCLAVPDAFFNHSLYEEAREEYLRVASSLPGRREGRMAAFRAGLCYVEMARSEEDREIRGLLLHEAEASFASLDRAPRTCLSGLGRAIVADQRGEYRTMSAALRDALAEHPDDPNQDAVREWLLAYLHGADEPDRRGLAECMPLAVDHCLDASGVRVIRDLVQTVRTNWEVPSFMTGRLQGKITDDTFRAEAKAFFGFWAARDDVIDEAARALAMSEKLRPYHMTDTVFALLELGNVEFADEVLAVFDRVRASLSEERFVVAAGLARAGIQALKGDLPGAEKLLLGLDCEPTDRAYNTARLTVARAEYDAGRHGQVFKMLRGAERHDTFAREHRAWFAIKTGDLRMAQRELEPLLLRGSHERGRNLANFLHGLCLLGEGKGGEAMRIFRLLPFERFPRTWTLGSHCASGRLSGWRLDRYRDEAFPWERKHLNAQMALLSLVRGDEEGFKELLAKSRETPALQ
jgi:serine/threonine-protein kinase